MKVIETEIGLITLIKQVRRKNLSISISDSGISVKAPYFASEARILDIVLSKRKLIERKLIKISAYKDMDKIGYYNGGKVSFLGKWFNVIYFSSALNIVNVESDNVVVYTTSDDLIEKIIKKWMHDEAIKIFNERLQFAVESFVMHHKISFPILKTKFMKSRWGSMSTVGVMTLNIFLICVPLECIDYVIMHELCHVIHHNHGKDFYKLQELAFPEYVKCKNILKKYAMITK